MIIGLNQTKIKQYKNRYSNGLINESENLPLINSPTKAKSELNHR